jgi:cytochrome c peroxidase
VFGVDALTKSPQEIIQLFGKAIVAFEASSEVSPFTSKYDAYLLGKAKLTDTELLGLRLFTGTYTGRPNSRPFKRSAHCVDCHATSLDWKKSPDIWTNGCYANLGVPRNPENLTYGQKENPYGYERSGGDDVDHGLRDVLYNSLGIPEFRILDPLQVNGAFKAPSVRNVDMRPYPGFVRAYMHNGVFKSLKAVVHFYNTRNLTTIRGEVIDFTKLNPYAGLKGTPLWAPPECFDANSLINPSGEESGMTKQTKPGVAQPDADAMQIGNLHLNNQMEDAIVDFLKTLNDGYFKRG